jgi:hypothetical protein
MPRGQRGDGLLGQTSAALDGLRFVEDEAV